MVEERLLVVRQSEELPFDGASIAPATHPVGDSISQAIISREIAIEDLLSLDVHAPEPRVLGEIAKQEGGSGTIASDNEDGSAKQHKAPGVQRSAG
jgi:hypothetical protein